MEFKVNILRVLTILTVLSFLSPFYYNFNEKNPSDSCFSDQSSLNIFEPITFTESADFLYAHGGGLNKCGCHFNRKLLYIVQLTVYIAINSNDIIENRMRKQFFC